MLQYLENALDRIDWALGRMTAIAVIAVMVIIVCDVVGRYLFSRPIAWVYDLVSIYFINIVLYAIASETLRTRGHIALDLHLKLLPRRAWEALQALAWFAVAVALSLACYRIGLSSFESLKAGEVHPGLYEWPVWIETGLVAVGLGLLIFRILLRLIRFCVEDFSADVLNADESAGARAP